MPFLEKIRRNPRCLAGKVNVDISPMNTEWRKICDNLQNRLNPGTYKVWVSPLIAEIDGGHLCLVAPNDFVANWVRERLLNDISAAATEVYGRVVPVTVTGNKGHVPMPTESQAQSRASMPQKAPSLAARGVTGGLGTAIVEDAAPRERARPFGVPVPVEAPARSMEQLAFPIHVPQRQEAMRAWRYGFDSFVVGGANNMAYAAARGMTRADAGVDTLFLSSGPGLGKTHLTQAVGQELCSASNRARPKVEYLTAEEFSTCFVQALRARDMDRFKGRFRDIDVLLLEDVHFLQGKEKMQDEVLSTVKALQERGSRVVLTSSFAPCELKNLDSSLVSRFCSGFLAGIEKPDSETRCRILQEKAKQQNVTLSEPVAEMLAERLTGDIRQLESCISNIVLKARLLGCPISAEMAAEILSQYAQDNPFLDVDAIVRKVCQGFGLTPEQLESRSRKQNYVLARNTIFYLARRHTELSLQDIGDRFSRRHSTVLKGIAAVERELRRESPLGRQIASTLAIIER